MANRTIIKLRRVEARGASNMDTRTGGPWPELKSRAIGLPLCLRVFRRRVSE